MHTCKYVYASEERRYPLSSAVLSKGLCAHLCTVSQPDLTLPYSRPLYVDGKKIPNAALASLMQPVAS